LKQAGSEGSSKPERSGRCVMRSLMNMKNKKVNPTECFQCGMPVAADQQGAVRFRGYKLVYCNQACWDAKGAEEQTRRKRATALHEAGHTLGNRLAKIPIETATIVPCRKYDGHVKGGGLAKYEEQAVIDLLGHAAELEFECYEGSKFYFEVTSDYAQALENIKRPLKNQRSEAWALANGYVHREPAYYEHEGEQRVLHKVGDPKWLFNRFDFRCREHYRSWMKATRLKKSDWKPLYDAARRKARRLAKQYRAYIERVAELLLQHETLTDDMIPQLGE